MSGSKTSDPADISSFAAPTVDDIACFETLDGAQRAELVRREIQKGIDSGVSNKTVDDVWREALRRVRGKARPADAV